MSLGRVDFVEKTMTHQSKLASVLRASGNLPPADKDLFRRLFVLPGSEAKVGADLGISQAELASRKSCMLKSLLRAA